MPSRGPHFIALIIAAFTVALLLGTAPNIGVTWDEPAYMVAAESYTAWFGVLASDPGFALSAEGIRGHWQVNHEHPPLDKIWSGLVWRLTRPILDDLTAHRLGNMLLAGGLVGLVYWVVARHGGRELAGAWALHSPNGAGLMAAGALLTMPRFFTHAHLAALDVPAAFAMFATTALFLFRRRLYLLRRLAVMASVGLPLPLLIWPWLYREFVPRALEYLLFLTIDHWEIGQWYLGRFTMPPPWHFPFLIVVAVVPLTLTLLYMLGIARTVVDRACPECREGNTRAFGGLLVLGALVPMLALAAGGSAVYDNDRMLMSSFPFLAALAGLGYDWIVGPLCRWAQRVSGPVGQAALPFLLAAALLIPHIASAARLYPHLLSYYSEAIGGLPGASRLGLETTYWSETYAEAIPYLNAHAQAGDTVWVQEWSHDVMHYYQLRGLLRRDLWINWPAYGSSVFAAQGVRGHPIPLGEADHIVLQYRQTGFEPAVWELIETRIPTYQLSYRGVPLIEVYSRQRGP
jgi:hypothetical protein